MASRPRACTAPLALGMEGRGRPLELAAVAHREASAGACGSRAAHPAGGHGAAPACLLGAPHGPGAPLQGRGWEPKQKVSCCHLCYQMQNCHPSHSSVCTAVASPMVVYRRRPGVSLGYLPRVPGTIKSPSSAHVSSCTSTAVITFNLQSRQGRRVTTSMNVRWDTCHEIL